MFTAGPAQCRVAEIMREASCSVKTRRYARFTEMSSRRKLDPAVLRALQALGREGGKIGGKARWKGVSAEERRAHARKAARARWAKGKKGA